jgi:hypothetical protein
MNLNNISVSGLLAGLIFGTLGLYVLRLAKREANMGALGIGMAMMIYPYFVESAWLTWGIGVGLTVMAVRSLR